VTYKRCWNRVVYGGTVRWSQSTKYFLKPLDPSANLKRLVEPYLLPQVKDCKMFLTPLTLYFLLIKFIYNLFLGPKSCAWRQNLNSGPPFGILQRNQIAIDHFVTNHSLTIGLCARSSGPNLLKLLALIKLHNSVNLTELGT